MDAIRQTAAEIIRSLQNARIQNLQAENTPTAQQCEISTKNTQATHTEATQKKDAFIAQLSEKNTNLERHLIDLSEKCSNAQIGAFKAMEKARCAVKEDNVVCYELAILQDGLQSWARKYSMESLNPGFKSMSAH